MRRPSRSRSSVSSIDTKRNTIRNSCDFRPLVRTFSSSHFRRGPCSEHAKRRLGGRIPPCRQKSGRSGKGASQAAPVAILASALHGHEAQWGSADWASFTRPDSRRRAASGRFCRPDSRTRTASGRFVDQNRVRLRNETLSAAPKRLSSVMRRLSSAPKAVSFLMAAILAAEKASHSSRGAFQNARKAPHSRQTAPCPGRGGGSACRSGAKPEDPEDPEVFPGRSQFAFCLKSRQSGTFRPES